MVKFTTTIYIHLNKAENDKYVKAGDTSNCSIFGS